MTLLTLESISKLPIARELLIRANHLEERLGVKKTVPPCNSKLLRQNIAVYESILAERAADAERAAAAAPVTTAPEPAKELTGRALAVSAVKVQSVSPIVAPEGVAGRERMKFSMRIEGQPSIEGNLPEEPVTPTDQSEEKTELIGRSRMIKAMRIK